MTTFSLRGRWYVVSIIALLLTLVFDIAYRIDSSRELAEAQFNKGFVRDASRREGMRNLLLRDVRSASNYALHSLAAASKSTSNEERAAMLNAAFSQMGFALQNSRYDFFEAFLIEQTSTGQLLLRGRYPSQTDLLGVSVAETPLLAHFDVDQAELFDYKVEAYQIDRDPLLLVNTPQPIVMGTARIVDGQGILSSWFLAGRVAQADLNWSVDLIGQQMVGGTTPMRVINMDAATDRCQMIWEVGVGTLDCDDMLLSEGVTYKTSYDVRGAAAETYSLYQPNEAYAAFRATASNVPGWRAAVPVVTLLLLLVNTLHYLRQRKRSELALASVSDSLSDKDSLNAALHAILSDQLEKVRAFASVMRKGDVSEDDRRYFDIAVSEFVQAKLSLNTLQLESPPVESDKTEQSDIAEVANLVALAQTVLEVSNIDSPVETQFFSADDLPETFRDSGSRAETALLAAIILSSETTDYGRIEVSLWTEDSDEKVALFIRIVDTGVGWGGLGPDGSFTISEIFDTSAARRALAICLRHSDLELVLFNEGEQQNEYQIRFDIGT